jgi:hypothetical protein
METALNRFAKDVVANSRKNLAKKGASGNLSKSLDYKLSIHQNSFSLELLMEDYGKFVDKGVSGTEKKYNTPYSYTGKYKMINPKALDKWVLRRGLKGTRNAKGQFVSRKSLKFAIATSIYKKGIKPSLFFTKPFKNAFKDLPTELVDAFMLDLDGLLEFTTK